MKKIMLFLLINSIYIHGMEEIPLTRLTKFNKTDDLRNTLDISNNDLKTIDDCYSTLTPTSALDYDKYNKLKLNNNMLQNVPENFVALFPNLTEFDVSHNSITSIDIGACFRAGPNIKHMNFSYNKINDVTWSDDHKIWYIEKDDTVTLPIINLIGNPITTNSNACDSLKEKYCKALYQVCHRAYPYSGFELLGSSIGTAGGIIVGFCSAQPLAHVIPMSALISIPVGCLLGTICGFGVVKLKYNDEIKERIQHIIVPIYVEENDQNGLKQKISFKSEKIKGCHNSYLCKFNC